MKEKKEKFLIEMIASGCAVLVGPLFSQSDLPFIKENCPLLFVDGGTDKGIEYHLNANRSCFSVGDGDSAKTSLDQIIPAEKDYSDLAFALNLIPIEVEKFILLGFLGGRKDHELANLGEVSHFLKSRKSPSQIYLADQIVALSSGDWRIYKEGCFSLMSLEKLQVRLIGAAKYQLTKWTSLEPCSSHGLSNEGTGEIEIFLKSPAFLYGQGINVK